jgi:hypothetical protein
MAEADAACVTISNLRLTAQSTTIIELGGTTPCSSYDVIHVTNLAELYGTVRLELINGFVPQPLDSFSIVTWATRIGTPTVIRGTSFPVPAGMTVTPTYLANELAIRIGARPGDANLDGAVNFNDLLLLASSYNTPSNRTWARGDFNRDGFTNFDDLLLLASNYNSPAGGAASSGGWALAQAAAVPEPTALLMSAMSITLGTRRRRNVRRNA